MRITLGRKTYCQQKIGQEKNKRLRPISNCKDDLRKGERGSEWERTSPDLGQLVLGLHVWEGTGEGGLTEPRELVLLSHFSRVRLLATPWTAAYQAPPSMGFSRQKYWSGVPLPSLRELVRTF